MSAYKSVQKGGLKLKTSKDSAKLAKAGKKEKKHKKKHSKKEKKHASEDEAPQVVLRAEPGDTRTQAEIRLEQKQLEREAALLKKNPGQTHVQKIEEFNRRLESLPDHYDIPKVGPG